MRWAAFLSVVAVAVGLVSGQTCSPGFEAVGGECLAFLTSLGTWFGQRDACMMAVNASLAKVTGELHNAVYQYITDNTALMDKCFWIGGTDQVSEGNWVWESDGTEIPLGAPHWDPCEAEPDGGSSENYLALCPDLYYYKDYPSTNEHHAICQEFS